MLRHFGAIGSLVLGAALAACSAPSEGTASPSDELTTIPITPAMQESIANCWVFGATTWLESLSARPVGAAPRDLSEAYVSYMWWFEQITLGPTWDLGSGTSTSSILPNGWWSHAVELLRRYGWMDEATFLDRATPTEYADRHLAALTAIRTELQSGELATLAQRADRKHVVEVLARAWQLTPEVAGDLTRVFGAGYERTLVSPAVEVGGTRVHRLSEIVVGHTAPAPPAIAQAVTAADVVGAPQQGFSIKDGQRSGPFAFSDVKTPTDPAIRGWLQRAQKALNQDLPVAMTEWSDDGQVDASGVYQAPAGSFGSDTYLHVVTIFDLAVETRDFGLLPAGVPETRSAALAASLRDDSRITLFRTKNPFWGRYEQGSSIAFADRVGVNDFSLDYLLTPYRGGRAVVRLTLPNDENLVLAR